VRYHTSDIIETQLGMMRRSQFLNLLHSAILPSGSNGGNLAKDALVDHLSSLGVSIAKCNVLHEDYQALDVTGCYRNSRDKLQSY
jgi:hypothetical protein